MSKIIKTSERLEKRKNNSWKRCYLGAIISLLLSPALLFLPWIVALADPLDIAPGIQSFFAQWTILLAHGVTDQVVNIYFLSFAVCFVISILLFFIKSKLMFAFAKILAGLFASLNIIVVEFAISVVVSNLVDGEVIVLTPFALLSLALPIGMFVLINISKQRFLQTTS